MMRSRVRTNRSETTHCQRDVFSRKASFKGAIVQRTHCPRDGTPKTGDTFGTLFGDTSVGNTLSRHRSNLCCCLTVSAEARNLFLPHPVLAAVRITVVVSPVSACCCLTCLCLLLSHLCLLVAVSPVSAAVHISVAISPASAAVEISAVELTDGSNINFPALKWA
jgi:hypothetical protein